MNVINELLLKKKKIKLNVKYVLDMICKNFNTWTKENLAQKYTAMKVQHSYRNGIII